jgi:hypothetical protein
MRRRSGSSCYGVGSESEEENEHEEGAVRESAGANRRV